MSSCSFKPPLHAVEEVHATAGDVGDFAMSPANVFFFAAYTSYIIVAGH